MEVAEIATTDSAPHSRTSSLSEDRFLIEKDGKFELVKTAEIKAIPLDSLVIKSAREETEINLINKRDSVKIRIENKIGHPKNPTKLVISELRYEIHSNSTSSLPPSRKAPTRLTTSSRMSLQIRERPKTAPIYTPKELEDTNQKKRREQADLAFMSWLDSKDRQLIQAKHSQPIITKPLTYNKSSQSTSNSDAYKMWLDNKKKQILQEWRIKDEKAKTTTITPTTTTGSTYVPQNNFESWLQKKRTQFNKEHKPTILLTAYRKKKAKSR